MERQTEQRHAIRDAIIARRRTSLRATALACAAAAIVALVQAQPAAAAKPHQHGVVKLDAALDGNTLTLQMEAPLDSLLGFERRPRTEAERKAADAVLARVKDPASLLKPAAAAACSAGATQLNAEVLAPAAAGDKGRDHAELEVSWTFTCGDAARLDAVEVGLFDAFRRIERIEVQVAGPKGQSRQTLTRTKRRLLLPR
jgi:Protein of unknown function (DUF2796)